MGFYSDMLPYATKASAGSGLHQSEILAQWADESAKGTSPLAKTANNYAGINWSPNSIAIGKTPNGFARYASKDQFVQDWLRVIHLSYYEGVLKASNEMDSIHKLGLSPYASSHYDSNKRGYAGQDLIDIYKVDHLSQYDTTATKSTLGTIPSGSMSNADITKYAGIGVAFFMAVLALTGGGNK